MALSQREKTTAFAAGLALLALGTAFAFFTKKKECKSDEELDADGNCVPKAPKPKGVEVVCAPGQHREGTGKDAHCVDDAVKPDPKDIDDIVKPVPIGGAFYKVKYGDWPGWGTAGGSNLTNPSKGFAVAVMYIRREMFEAAKERGGLSDAAAWAWVNTAIGGSKVIHAANLALDIMLCSAFNDACYGTWGYCGTIAHQHGRCKNITNHPGPQGRAIQYEKKHPDNIARFKQGQVAARYCTIGSAGQAGDGLSKNASGKTGHYPQLWIPMLDRERLWATGGNGFPTQIEVEPTPHTWDDSSPMSSPPPFITRGGEILDFSGTLHLPSAFGCAGEAMNFRFGG